MTSAVQDSDTTPVKARTRLDRLPDDVITTHILPCLARMEELELRDALRSLRSHQRRFWSVHCELHGLVTEVVSAQSPEELRHILHCFPFLVDGDFGRLQRWDQRWDPWYGEVLSRYTAESNYGLLELSGWRWAPEQRRPETLPEWACGRVLP